LIDRYLGVEFAERMTKEAAKDSSFF